MFKERPRNQEMVLLKRRMLNEDFINVITDLMEGYEEDGQSQTLGCTQQKDKSLAVTRNNKGLDKKKNILTVSMVEHWNEVT